MQAQDIPINAIQWPSRLRAINPQRVEALKSSMAELGLLNPITIYSSEDGEPVLAAGAHRVKAAKALGWETIEARVITGDELMRQLAEIDENLCRLELGSVERAMHLCRRKELWTAMQAARQAVEPIHPPSSLGVGIEELGGSICATQRSGDYANSDAATSVEVDARGQQKKRQQQTGFAASTAVLTGDSKATLNREIHRGEALGDILPGIAGTSLDSGVELDALTKLQPEEREDLAQRAKAGENVSARDVLANKIRLPPEQGLGQTRAIGT